ncbi:MAG: hypothetical protein FJX53_01085 [Alphaproteobacteria bacterium]|nr:hypothetical protein [Alphaproteobacteria bacterium]
MPGRCESAYLAEVGDYGGGSTGWDTRFNLYGFFQLNDGRRTLVPLVNFNRRNDALIFMDELASGR